MNSRRIQIGIAWGMLAVLPLVSSSAPDKKSAPEAIRSSQTGQADSLDVDTNAVPPEIPASLRRGYALAHGYCQACHLFPEPDLLDKRTWLNGALRKMAPFLGVARINLDNRPDGKFLKESELFPNLPMVSEKDWEDICNYYIQSAPEKALPQGPREKISIGLKEFGIKPIRYLSAPPMTSLVKIDPFRKRFYAGDAEANVLEVLDAKAEPVQALRLEGGPVSLSEQNGRFYVTLIGHVFPSDERDGKIVSLTELGGQVRPDTLLEHLQRPTDAVFADINGDGKPDIVLSSFGNYLGHFSWFENRGDGHYEEHVLIDRPGAIRSIVRDMNKDGLPDILVLMAQGREGIYLFLNQGKGAFQQIPLLEFQPAFGSTYFELADFNGDGFADILATNGDNGEYPSPYKRYHGVRIYLNDGQNHFKEAWFYPLNGAFKAMAADFNQDGRLDIAAISFFPDYGASPEESFVLFENKEGLRFEPHSFAESTMGRWLTMDVGDLDGDGDVDIVLGSFTQGPQSISIPPALRQQWSTKCVSVMVLKNKLK